MDNTKRDVLKVKKKPRSSSQHFRDVEFDQTKDVFLQVIAMHVTRHTKSSNVLWVMADFGQTTLAKPTLANFSVLVFWPHFLVLCVVCVVVVVLLLCCFVVLFVVLFCCVVLLCFLLCCLCFGVCLEQDKNPPLQVSVYATCNASHRG